MAGFAAPQRDARSVTAIRRRHALPPLLILFALLAPPPAADAPPPAPLAFAPVVIIVPAPDIVPVIEAPAPPPPPVRLPAGVRAMIDAATESGDAAAVAAILRFARQTNPDTRAQIDALDADFAAKVAEKQAQIARERATALANAALLDNWKGELEAGGSRLTGTTEGFGLYGSAKLSREGLRWRNTLTGRIDYQRTDGETVTERGIAAWQSNYKFGDRFYVYGLGQYEHDRFLGYTDRYTGGGGIGYRILPGPRLRVDFEGGPALRRTNFIEREAVDRIAARGSIAARWAILPTLTLTQDGAIYVEQGNRNATATTALDTRLIGALKARLSYNLTYEHGALAATESLDTITRATIVYSF